MMGSLLNTSVLQPLPYAKTAFGQPKKGIYKEE